MQIGYLDVVPARTPLTGRPNVRLLLLHLSLWPCVGAVAVSLILRILSSQATALGRDSLALSAFPLRLAAPVILGPHVIDDDYLSLRVLGLIGASGELRLL